MAALGLIFYIRNRFITMHIPFERHGKQNGLHIANVSFFHVRQSAKKIYSGTVRVIFFFFVRREHLYYSIIPGKLAEISKAD